MAAERCAAFVSDEVALTDALKDDVDKRYTIAFDTIDVTPWTITIKATDVGLAAVLSARLIDYHRTGFLIGRAKTWALPPSPYLAAMHQYYKQ